MKIGFVFYLRLLLRSLAYSPIPGTRETKLPGIVGASISYRLAFGPNAGKKALTLQTLPSTFESGNQNEQLSKRSGFSLHAGVACKVSGRVGQRKKLERL